MIASQRLQTLVVLSTARLSIIRAECLLGLHFSVAIHVDPEVLIVDEILAVGDLAFQRRCMNKFFEIRDGGCSILFVSHDQYQVKSICQRALYLDQGRQKLFGFAGNVIDQYMIDMEERISSCLPSPVHGESLPVSSACVEDEKVAPIPTVETSAGSEVVGDKQPEVAPESPEQLLRITQVTLLDESGSPVSLITTGQSIKLTFDFVVSRSSSRTRSVLFSISTAMMICIFVERQH